MTNEEKKLLYKDLSARLPYRPFVCFAEKHQMPLFDIIASFEDNELMSINGLNPEEVKPYLRRMSNMTEEEEEVYKATCVFINDGYVHTLRTFEFFNEYHFDYRGLIDIGLALEAPKDMYKTE